jgi:hypothetical protein
MGMSKSTYEGVINLTWPVAAVAKPEYRSDLPNVAGLMVRLDHIELGALDLWIEDQPGRKLSRPEAARKLISEALVKG